MDFNSQNKIRIARFGEKKYLFIPFLGMVTSCFSQINTTLQRPNIILILADDMGFSDLSCYGGEIHTPNLDSLAANGLRFSQFYNMARCCPSRASLLTGLYPHQAGVGYMTEKLGDTNAYQGYLREDRKTIAEILTTAGYTTLHVGKWHVGSMENGAMPCTRGFERGWSPVGQVNYWNTKTVYEDGKISEVSDSKKKYLTDVTGDKAIEYIKYATTKEAPFFMYLAFNAAHWPLHAKSEDIAKYRGKFLRGWDKLREERAGRIDSIGLVPAIDIRLIKDPAAPLWSEIAENDTYPGYHAFTSGKQDQDDWDAKMAVYAAQIECMDNNIGRVVAELSQLGILNNTLIIFLQDNGGCAESIEKNKGILPGGPDSYTSYNLPWAYLSNTPFRMFKHFLYEGGISTSFIIHWPNGLPDSRKGDIEKKSFGDVIDILPTCLAVAGIEHPRLGYLLEGQNLVSVIKGMEENSGRELFWEHEGNRAVRKGEWKLISRYQNDIRFFQKWKFPRSPRTNEWELYNIRNDRWESKECSNEHPDIVKDLIKDYIKWSEKVGALPREKVIINSIHEF